MMNKVSIASAIIAASVMASTGHARGLADKLGQRLLEGQADGGWERVSSTDECGAELYEMYTLNPDLLDGVRADIYNIERAYVAGCWK